MALTLPGMQTGLCRIPDGILGVHLLDNTLVGTKMVKSRGGKYLRGTIVGHGQIPVAQCIAMLKNAGYEGYLSLEFEGMEDCLTALQAGHDYLRRFA